MSLVLPVLLLLCAAILFVRIAALAYYIIDDMIRAPFNPRYMATWAASLVLALSLLALLGWFIWYMGLTVASTMLR